MSSFRRALILTFSASLPLGAWVAAPSEAYAGSLQNCPAPSKTASPRLPIGVPGPQATRMFAEKTELRSFIANLTLGDVSLPAPLPPFGNPVDLYHLTPATQNTGGVCQPGITLPGTLPAADAQELERLWAMFAQYDDAQDRPALYMLSLHAQDFLLPAMEDVATCDAHTPGMDWDPMVSWLANWEYPGNPYHTDASLRRAVKLRGASWLALQLIMLDWNHWGGVLPTAAPSGTTFTHPPPGLASNGVSSEMNVGFELAGHLGHLAFTYLQVKDALPVSTRVAMETLLRMYAERLHVWGPYGQQNNMAIRATFGNLFVHQATGDPAVLGYYQATLAGFFGNQSGGRFFPAGYFTDDGRFDSGYNGWNILHVLRLLQLDTNPPQELLDAATTLFDLHGHLTFRDPDGSWYSPNAFNTRSFKGAIGKATEGHPRASSGGGIQRFLPALQPFPGLPDGLPFAYAFMRDAPYLGPQDTTPWIPGGHLDPTSPTFYRDLICQLSDVPGQLTSTSQVLPPGAPYRARWPQMPQDRDYAMPTLAVTLHRSPALQTWAQNVAAKPELEDFPFDAEGPLTRSFDDELVYAKFTGPAGSGRPYAALIHAGPVSPSDHYVGGTTQPGYIPAGFGGGQLSMFWGPFTGASVRGMRHGYNNTPADDWAEWRAWPIHAVTLLSAAGDWTSSARIIVPSTDVTYYGKGIPSAQLAPQLDQNPCLGWPVPEPALATPPTTTAPAVLVRVCGDIPDQLRRFGPTPAQVLAAPMPYQRAIYADEDGMYVRTTVSPFVNDPLNEAWETLPIYDQYWPTVTNYPAADILLFDVYGQMTLATAGMAPVSDVVRVYVARADGAFQVLFDQPERVGVSPDWLKGYAKSNNLMIDLGRGALPGSLGGPVTVGYRIEMLTDAAGNTPPP